jgi:hypothetical protein
MESRTTPTVSSFLPTTIILVILGWGGLFLLFQRTMPTVGPRWLFFFLWVLALTGTALPGVAFLNRRFPTVPPATPGIIIREAIWVGLYGATLAWLQLGRVLNLALAVLLASGFIAIEILVRLRERSQWEP